MTPPVPAADATDAVPVALQAAWDAYRRERNEPWQDRVEAAVKAYVAASPPAPVSVGGEVVEAVKQWEYFQDEAYFGMWCVRAVGSRQFGEGFHTVSREEAVALVAAISRKA